MNAYLQSLIDAKNLGFYIPEIEIVYIRQDDFKYPHVLLSFIKSKFKNPLPPIGIKIR